MTVNVIEFPREWYQYIVTQKFTLRSMTQSSGRNWGGGSQVTEPYSQFWINEVTMAPQRDPVLQDMDALVTDLKGRSGVLRMSNSMRLTPWYDRNLTPTTAVFSDGSTFSDGSGFANSYLPPNVYIVEAAARGATYLTLGGFPPSTANVLRKGDLLQVMPNGIAGQVPHLYKAMIGGSSDASGFVGIRIEPRLRAGVAVGDQVSLRYPSTVFRLVDDNQADIEGSGAGIGNFGFALIEALDLVP